MRDHESSGCTSRHAVALLLVSACAHPLRAAEPGRGLSWPKDHAAHEDAQTEWWHFHGHVKDDQGRRYDWFLGFVKQHTDLDHVAGIPVRFFVDPFHVAYFTMTDRTSGTFVTREKHNFPDTWAADAATGRLSVRHDGWTASLGPDGDFSIEASSLGNGLRLTLHPLRDPSLVGDEGYLYVPPRSSNYYYSIPRMSASGEITVNGEVRTVEGLGWLKHQWGFMYNEHVAGWVWFGAQLAAAPLARTSTGTELEMGVVFDRDWNLVPGSFATIREHDGSLTQLDVRSVGVTASGETWRSPETGTVYPTGWTLTIPGRGTLTLSSPVQGQEMVVFPANFWAGGQTVTGVFDGKRVVGDSFTEVVGIDEPFGRGLLSSGKPDELPPDSPGHVQLTWAKAKSSTAAEPLAVEESRSTSAGRSIVEELFLARCAPCHGSRGRGDGPAAAGLTPHPRDLGAADWQRSISDAEIARVIREGGASIGLSPVMPAFADLEGRLEIVEALVHLIRELGGRDSS